MSGKGQAARLNLRNNGDASIFFAAAQRYGVAEIHGSPNGGGHSVKVWAHLEPGHTSYGYGKNGNYQRVETADHWIYRAQLFSPSGFKGAVSRDGRASDILQFMVRNGAPINGYCPQVEAPQEQQQESSSGSDTSWYVIVVGLMVFGLLAGLFIKWLDPIVGGAFKMIGDVLSVVFKLGLVAGVAAFAVWLWRAAGPLPGDGVKER